jgi:hypothetical protein
MAVQRQDAALPVEQEHPLGDLVEEPAIGERRGLHEKTPLCRKINI